MTRTALLLTVPMLAASIPAQRAQAQANWALDSVPATDIPATARDGGLNFEQASGATLLAARTLVIGDGSARTVRFFDTGGQQRNRAGREGGGPGEFRHVRWLGQCGPDSVFVWDSRLRRMTVLDGAGRLARMYRLPAESETPTLAALACSRSGVFALLGFPRDARPPSPDGDSPHYTAPLWLADAEGDVTHELGIIPAMESRPLGKVTSLAVSARRIYVGTKASDSVTVYGITGQRLDALPLGLPLRQPTRAHYEAAIDQQVAGLALRNERQQMKQMLLRIPMPEYLPPYTALFTDPDGLLWVQLSAHGDPETWLRALSPDGEVMADARLPFEARIFEVGRGYVLGSYTDESDEPHVAVWRLRRPGEP